MPDTSVSPWIHTTGAFQATTPALEFRGSKFEVSLCVGSQRGTAWGSRNFFHQLKPASFCNQKLWTRKFLALEPWAGTPPSQEVPPKFLSTICGWQTSPFWVCAPPINQGGYSFFNSVVVRLPYNLISDGSKWWLLYILVVILTWLCQEASHVCLCLHLDWKSQKCLLIEIYGEFSIVEIIESCKIWPQRNKTQYCNFWNVLWSMICINLFQHIHA